MSCAKISAASWGWCLLLGVGELVWGQIVAFVPTKRLPKQMTVSIQQKSVNTINITDMFRLIWPRFLFIIQFFPHY